MPSDTEAWGAFLAHYSPMQKQKNKRCEQPIKFSVDTHHPSRVGMRICQPSARKQVNQALTRGVR